VENLSVRSGQGVELLRPVSFDLPEGAGLFVTGASGSGKSTLLEALAGVSRHDVSGHVDLAGPVVLGTQDAALCFGAYRRVGVQLEDVVARSERGRFVASVGELLAGMGLGDRDVLRRFPSELSGGMLKRVVIAGLLATRSAVVMLDEPTAGIDYMRRWDILAAVMSHARSFVLATHDPELLSRARPQDRLLVLSGGGVATIGSVGAEPLVCGGSTGSASPAASGAIPSAATGRRPEGDTEDLQCDRAQSVRGVPLRSGSASLLVASGVCAAYGRGPDRLVDFGVELRPGQILNVVGESGAGKSTLIACIAGFVKPRSGRLEVDGDDLATCGSGGVLRVRRKLGLILQSPRTALDPTMSALESVAEMLVHLRGLPAAAARASAEAALADVGLTREGWLRKPAGLSGGQCQRVCIARALVHEPKLLLADEPTANLDVPAAQAVLSLLLRAVSDRGLALVYVTHRLSEPKVLGGRLIVLKGGRIVEHVSD
jgi:peptide/nickel transport system ATP-binding protein